MKCDNRRSKSIGIILAILIVILSLTPPVRQISEFPNEITMLKGQAEKIEVSYPLILSVHGESKESVQFDSESKEVKPLELGEIDLEFKLFGHIPLRTINIDVISPIELIPGGNSVGIKLRPSDTMVVGFHEIETPEGSMSPGKEAGLQEGDAILEIEGDEVGDVENTARILEKYSKNEDKIEVVIDRDGKEKVKLVEPEECPETNDHLTGMYIRDTKAGVGTLTYVDPENDRFGALGHSISDAESNQPLDIRNGQIVSSNIVDVTRGEENKPGEKRGAFIENNGPIGSIDTNTEFGIFGDKFDEMDSQDLYYEEPIPVGLSQHVEEGPAKILTVLEGQNVESYDIKIRRVMPQNYDSSKGMVIEVTDPELIDKTGGIIQGMSGSPIIQDDKLVGSVTHVFMNNPKKGYGTYMEWMLTESGDIEYFEE
ncbi:SpoIVB peptidase [Natranaerofaba carboxydovora]|uniref:SpoIVB peptidase n=1 Tax=Natranaerofaba carboxydovora TaxID=2742683 RepID=UPI001F13FA66|nr:SpoIVB peptidase [Natranaerofaba carboxydovora]UMZ73941.1 SpoIVB peptidase [Natranaerofaba carboxydovora]